jgi:hypothetical protein
VFDSRVFEVVQIYGKTVNETGLAPLQNLSKSYIRRMKRFKHFIEWQAFGVCTAIGNCHLPHPYVVYLCVPAFFWLARRHLHDSCLLDEYEKVYGRGEEKPMVEFIGMC